MLPLFLFIFFFIFSFGWALLSYNCVFDSEKSLITLMAQILGALRRCNKQIILLQTLGRKI